jgi:redox-sensitive bicupin YhaK (pirin superfamily)
MSAGHGVQHSEFNPSSNEGVHFLQIWIQPNVRGIPPSYEEKRFSEAEKRGRLRLIASPDQAEGSVLIRQDVRVYAGLFDDAETADLAIGPGRRAYVHVARGAIAVNGVTCKRAMASS